MLVLLICISVCASLGLSCMGLSLLPGLGDDFLSCVREVFNYYLFKYFLRPFFFFFWNPYSSNVGAFNGIPEVSESVLISFHYFFFILFHGRHFHHSIFQVTYVFFFLSSFAINSLVYFLFQWLHCSFLFICSLVLLDLC